MGLIQGHEAITEHIQAEVENAYAHIMTNWLTAPDNAVAFYEFSTIHKFLLTYYIPENTQLFVCFLK